MKKLKLCYIAPPQNTNTLRWVSYFRDVGHEVYLITDDSYFIRGIKVYVVKSKPEVSKIVGLIRKARNVYKIRQVIYKIKPDILHSHFLCRYGIMGALSQFHPFFGTAWGSDIFLHPYMALKRYWYTRYCLKKLDLITFDSFSLQRSVQRLGGDPKKCHRILWGVDTDLFQPNLPINLLRKKLNISKEAKVIYSVRTARPIFNIDIILKAFKLVLSERKEIILMVKTNPDPVHYDYIEKQKHLAVQLRIEDKVKWLPFCPYEELPPYYNLSDIVISIASSDGTPSSILEAMACGTSLITSDIESMKEWIQNGWNGYIVNPRNEIALKETILKVLDNPLSIKRKFAERNRRLVIKKGDYYKNMEKMEKLYYRFLKT